MASERTIDLTERAQDIARLLQSRDIRGEGVSRAFQKAIKERPFRDAWTQAWRKTADAMGGRMGLTSAVEVLNHAARLLDMAEGWDTIGVLASDAVTRLISAGEFDGFLDWIPGACSPDTGENNQVDDPPVAQAKAA